MDGTFAHLLFQSSVKQVGTHSMGTQIGAYALYALPEAQEHEALLGAQHAHEAQQGVQLVLLG